MGFAGRASERGGGQSPAASRGRGAALGSRGQTARGRRGSSNARRSRGQTARGGRGSSKARRSRGSAAGRGKTKPPGGRSQTLGRARGGLRGGLRADDISAFDAFLANHPESPRTAEARTLREALLARDEGCK